MNIKPVTYRIKIHLDSFRNGPIGVLHASSPFMPMQKGDKIYPYNLVSESKESYFNKDMVSDDYVLEIVEVMHLLAIQSDELHQSISVRVIESHIN